MNLSFITANYVGQALNYGAGEWPAHEEATVAAATAASFRGMAQRVKSMGFSHIDIWKAHCSWQFHPVSMAREVRKVCADLGLTITSYAGGITIKSAADLDAPFAYMNELGAPIFAGGIWSPLASPELGAAIETACQKHNLQFGLEAHVENTIDEILNRIDHGKHPHYGICFDTGWCGPRKIDALAMLRQIRPYLRILHLKDHSKPETGRHGSCTLGDGVVAVEAVARELTAWNFAGTVCIEHEPFDHDPSAELAESLRRARAWVA
jgi:L-ribulose-5-phosphate 3-epimerase